MKGSEARLAGTVARPEIELHVAHGDLHAVNGETLVRWAIRTMKAQYVGGLWRIGTTPPKVAEMLTEAGFEVRVSESLPESVTGVEDLWDPLAVAPKGPDVLGFAVPDGCCAVLARLAGPAVTAKVLGAVGRRDPGDEHWVVDLDDLPIDGVALTARTAALAEITVESAPRGSSNIASSTGQDAEVLAALVAAVGADVPDWFGLDLDPYQRAGALALAAGRGLLCDEMGVGKTRQALATAAVLGARRTLVIVPPVTITGWAREVTESGLAATDDAPDGALALFRSGRKAPEVPVEGVVIVSDSLVTSRKALRDELVAWAADVVIVDEAHRAKTWTSKRSRALRSLAATAQKCSLAVTGTPLFANTAELPAVLAVGGHLTKTFGGYQRFFDRYVTSRTFRPKVGRSFTTHSTNTKTLPELVARLDSEVWVRRVLADVAAELPTRRRVARHLDVDLTGYRQAHVDVVAIIDDWIEAFIAETGATPKRREVFDWLSAEVSMTSRLRRAAGLAKVPAAVEMIAEWVTDHADETHPDGGFARPLLVWGHHREVTEALAAAVPAQFPAAGVIVGSTPDARRTEIIDDFQAGQVPVLVASIHAAGVGITLTRGCDVIFVETDWTPAVIAQAEGRTVRRGQTRPVTVTTLCAADTLDERIQSVLATKTDILDVVLAGADHDVAVVDTRAPDGTDTASTAFDLLGPLVKRRAEVIRRRSRTAG